MADQGTFFRNRFPQRLGDEVVKRYTREHIRRLEAAGPVWKTTHTETQALYHAHFRMGTDEDVLATVSKGSTLAKNQALDALLDGISRYEGAIRMKWGRASAEYLRFYPRGITDYRKATLDTIEDRLLVFERALEEFGDHLPEDVVQAFLAPVDPEVPESGGTIVRFRAARSTQVTLQETTGDHREASAATRRALAWQLTKNMHLVAIAIAGKSDEDRAAGMRLFPTHLLGSARRKSKGKVKGKTASQSMATPVSQPREPVQPAAEPETRPAQTPAAAPAPSPAPAQPTAAAPSENGAVKLSLPG